MMIGTEENEAELTPPMAQCQRKLVASNKILLMLLECH